MTAPSSQPHIPKPAEIETSRHTLVKGPVTFEVTTAKQFSKPLGEDMLGVFEHSTGVVLVVADGAHRQGNARAAAEETIARIGKKVTSLNGRIADIDWTAVLRTLDHHIGSNVAGETTAVVAAFDAERISGASAGDSDIATVTLGESLRYLTLFQNKLRLGTGSAKPVDFRTGSAWDIAVVATDGFWNHVSRADLVSYCETHRHNPDAAELLALARKPDGSVRDDTSIIVCRRHLNADGATETERQS